MKPAVVPRLLLTTAAAAETAPAATAAPAISPTTGTNAKKIATRKEKPSRMDLVLISRFAGFVNVCVNCRFSEAI